MYFIVVAAREGDAEALDFHAAIAAIDSRAWPDGSSSLISVHLS